MWWHAAGCCAGEDPLRHLQHADVHGVLGQGEHLGNQLVLAIFFAAF